MMKQLCELYRINFACLAYFDFDLNFDKHKRYMLNSLHTIYFISNIVYIIIMLLLSCPKNGMLVRRASPCSMIYSRTQK